MTTLVLPFHQDERVGERSIVLPVEAAPRTVEPRLTGRDQWQRLVALYDRLGDAVAGSIRSGEPTTVVAGEGLRFPAAGGPTADAVLHAPQRLLDTRRVAVLEIACPWHEPIDDEQAGRLAELLSRVTGLAYDT